ncbi:MAG: hypothetical protein LBF28_02780 [Rickettsiales bacterium]|jgi:hypothetical protein|nr:hypothetical protein [Rickettsiales bacterium]
MAKSEYITVTLPTGTCTYQKITDVCGTVTSNTPCTQPDTCAAGYIKRNGECAKTCESGKVFESSTSNACIACIPDNYQGVNATGDACVKCSKGSQFFNKATKSCIAKTALKEIKMDAMKACGMCNNVDNFEKCVKLIALDENVREFDGTWPSVQTACSLNL